MPPKKVEDTAIKDQLELLCILMSTALVFQPDLNAAAEAFDLAQPRNVTRKINSIIEPIGYTMRRKKVVKVADNDDDAAGPGPSTAANKTKSAPKTVMKKPTKGKGSSKNNGGNSDDEEIEADHEEEAEGHEESSDKDGSFSPVTRAILDATAGSDVTPDTDSSSEEEVVADVKGKGTAT